MPKQQQQQQQQQQQNQTDKRITRKYSYPVEEKREARVTYLTEFELTNQSPNVKHMKTNGIKPIDPDLDSTNHRSRGQRSEDELSAVSTSKTFFLEIYYFMMMRFHFMLKVVFTVQCSLDGILNCYKMYLIPL